MKQILFTLLFMLSLNVSAYDTNNNAEKDAVKAIITATYKQSGVEGNVDKFVQEKIIPQEYKEVLGNVTIVINAMVTKRLETKWNF